MIKLYKRFKIELIFLLIFIGIIVIFLWIKGITFCSFNFLDYIKSLKASTFILKLFSLLAFSYTIYRYIELKNKAFDNFVKIKLNIEGKRILTTVINDVNVKKKIEFACIIITPEDNFSVSLDEINEEFNESKEIELTNDLIKWKDKNQIQVGYNKLFIPLPFYSIENVAIGNEHLTFEKDVESFNLAKGLYDVRFFVFSAEEHLHRSTHRILKID